MWRSARWPGAAACGAAVAVRIAVARQNTQAAAAMAAMATTPMIASVSGDWPRTAVSMRASEGESPKRLAELGVAAARRFHRSRGGVEEQLQALRRSRLVHEAEYGLVGDARGQHGLLRALARDHQAQIRNCVVMASTAPRWARPAPPASISATAPVCCSSSSVSVRMSATMLDRDPLAESSCSARISALSLVSAISLVLGHAFVSGHLRRAGRHLRHDDWGKQSRPSPALEVLLIRRGAPASIVIQDFTNLRARYNLCSPVPCCFCESGTGEEFAECEDWFKCHLLKLCPAPAGWRVLCCIAMIAAGRGPPMASAPSTRRQRSSWRRRRPGMPRAMAQTIHEDELELLRKRLVGRDEAGGRPQ